MTRSTILTLIACFCASHAAAAEPIQKQMSPAKMPPPVFLTMKDLGKGRLPDGRLVIYFKKEDWERRLDGAKHVPGPPPEGALGMFVIRDPFGDYLGFEACVGKSTEKVACVYVRGTCKCSPDEGRQEITVNQGCRLVRRYFDRCEGSCDDAAKQCQRIIYDPGPCPPGLPPGVYCLAPFVTCECN